MRKYIITAFLTISSLSFSQKKIDNLNFEKVNNNLPVNWEIFGNGKAKVFADHTEKQEGKFSTVIESDENNGFKGLALKLPENYAGKQITFSGYIKTENVTDGFAGLWMRIDPDIGFDNMQSQGLHGTNDWKKYEITLKLSPKNTEKIVIGALLSGKGKMWVDNLKITVDGKDITHANIFEKKLTKIDFDKEFDSGSKISNIDLGKNNFENVKNLGLIWGYLKYYHPNIAAGNYNWDYELFRIYPKIARAPASQRDKVLTEWIKGLGKYQTSKIAEPQNFKIKPDLEWITNSGFSKELTEELSKLKNAKRPKANYYVNLLEPVGNPDFKNENPYIRMNYPDEGFRLLSLYRYWNIIQYYFPYKNLIDEDWKGVLTEFIPKFVNAKNESEYALASLEIIGRIHDAHANIWNYNPSLEKYFGDRYTPIKLTFAEDKAVVNGFYNNELGQETGLKQGDIITEIDGKNIDTVIKNMLKYLPASNYHTQLRDISSKLLRSNENAIHLKILRNNKKEEKTIKTYKFSEINYRNEDKEFFKMHSKDIAYLYMGSVEEKGISTVFDQIKNTKGLVIDLRSYPADFVVFSMGKLLKPNSSDFVKFTKTGNGQPGLFTFTKNENLQGSGSNYHKGKIAILINEQTQSRGEFHAMAFRTAPNAKVFGSTTAGADGNVSKIILPGNISTMISGIGIYYPDGKETQRVGIVPDVEVKPTVEGIKNNKDEVLEKAIEWINN
ncbi:S41 family peptidase [Chryseobacterium sp. SSA4.19]|uniref:S41 family peptidase n=1 Tax=Chryseobacterium sp. SSA4.19 TaxID=2919915 RepID=UPI001F4E5CE8|nr:S41 family peptidase [Chryseobacterium sp. SSA4.19]MCJ8153557.1 S41 family peptidase [Chryseobacterium sp. SSA4.19]